MRASRFLLAVAVASCAGEASSPSAVPVASVTAPLRSPVPPPRPNLFLAQTSCASGSLCPVAPAFPKVAEVYFEPGGRPCLHGLDRDGCLDADGWHLQAPSAGTPTAGSGGRFAAAPPVCQAAAGEMGWVVPLERAESSLFWQKNGKRWVATPSDCRALAPVPLEPLLETEKWTGIAAREPNDVWVWTPRFFGHFDGVRWERSMMSAPCIRDPADASVVAQDGSIWFVRCEDQTRGLVRFDPRTNVATAAPVSPALGLAIVSGKVTATDFDEQNNVFRQHVFEADGRETGATPIDRPFLRAGFDDGSVFVAPSGLFTEVVRVGGSGAATIGLPSPARGFYAPSPRELWVGGEKLHRWRDGMMGEIAYRPDAKRAVVEVIAGSGANDIWVASRPAAGGAGANESPVHLSHWDGAMWRQEELAANAGKANALAVGGPNDAWLTTDDALYHWNGASWTMADHFPSGRGPSIALTPAAVFVLGNDTVYRRAR
jgi:hypothetical protein